MRASTSPFLTSCPSLKSSSISLPSTWLLDRHGVGGLDGAEHVGGDRAGRRSAPAPTSTGIGPVLAAAPAAAPPRADRRRPPAAVGCRARRPSAPRSRRPRPCGSQGRWSRSPGRDRPDTRVGARPRPATSTNRQPLHDRHRSTRVDPSPAPPGSPIGIGGWPDSACVSVTASLGGTMAWPGSPWSTARERDGGLDGPRRGSSSRRRAPGRGWRSPGSGRAAPPPAHPGR